MAITISTSDLNRIKSVLAFPSATQILLTDDQIKELIIRPVIEQYYTKFPIKTIEEKTLTSGTENSYDFPDLFTFGALDVRVVGKDLYSGSGNSFWSLAAYSNQNATMRGNGGGGAYGVKGYNPSQIRQSRMMQRQADATYANQFTISSRVDKVARKVYVYSEASGRVNVTWAKWSEDFNFVMFEYKNDVIHLCQAGLCDHLANTAGIIQTNTDISINTGDLKSLAEDLRSKVLEKWDGIPDIILIRFS